VRIPRTYVVRNKYRVVGNLLQEAEGSLLDVGARDRRLAAELNLQRLKYYSADVSVGHDYQLDLEQELNLPDGMFDYVVALDVLEHIEHIHQAFYELARITCHCLIVGLPNMATLSRRWSFLWHGHLDTRKYDLGVEHPGDRHRWLTVYPQINTFIEVNAPRVGFNLERVMEEIGGNYIAKVAGRLLVGLAPAGWLTDRCIYVLTRR
jgi:hypothetical protein